MSNFIPIETDDNQFYIEVLPVEGQTGIKQRSRENLPEKLTKNDFNQMIRQAVMPACQTFVQVWQDLNQPLTAERAEVEFNLGFTASGSAVIVQASGQASFKVKVSWKFKEDEGIPIALIRSFLDKAGIEETTSSLKLYNALIGEEAAEVDDLPAMVERPKFERLFKPAIDNNVLIVKIPDPPTTVQIPPQEFEKLKQLIKLSSKTAEE